MKIPGGISEDPKHLTDTDLLRYADGESPAPDLQAARVHLNSCWTCREKLRDIESLVGDVVRLRESVLLPSAGTPRLPFRAVRLRIAEHAAGRQPSGNLFRRLLRAPLKVAGAIAAALVISVLVWPVGRVSAKEALARAATAENRMLASVEHPVLLQKLKVRKIAGGKAEETVFASWREYPNGRVRRSGGDAGTLSELEAIYRANGLRFDQPLSAAAFAAWWDGLPSAAEEFHDADGPTITAENLSAAGPDSIRRAELRLRPADWRPLSQRLTLAGRVFEIVELSAEVKPLTQAVDLILSPPQTLVAKAVTPARPPKASTSPVPLVPDLPAGPRKVSPAEIAAAEVEVWFALNRAGALLGHAIEMNSHGSRIAVTGVMPSAELRDNAQKAIRAVDSLGIVDVNLKTPEDLTPANVSAPASAATWLRATRLPIEELLARSPGAENAGIRLAALANQVIRLADESILHGYTLRRLRSRFPSERYLILPICARWLLDALAREHLQALRLAILTLHDLQEPVFALFPPSGSMDEAWTPDGDSLDDLDRVHSLLHRLYAGASPEAPARSVPELAAGLEYLSAELNSEASASAIFTTSQMPQRSSR